jgi:uncharacterized protein YbcI
MAHESPLSHSEGANGSMTLAISNAIVGIYKQQFGRGPTKARSHFAGPDTLVCVLENTFTPAERKMIELKEHQRVRELRLFFQHATEDVFKDAVMEITGRQVRSFGSATDTDTDTSFEMFTFEPQPEDQSALSAS